MSTVEVGGDATAVLGPSLERVQALREAGMSLCVQAVLALEGELRARHLGQVLDRVVARHRILCGLTWTTSDVTAILPAARGGLRERRLHDERRALADSARAGRFVRAHLLCWGDRRHELLLTLDARGADAGTMSALSTELMTAYAGAPRCDDPLSYAEVVRWQLALAEDEGEQRGRLYWELHGRWCEADWSQPVAEPAPSHASAFATTTVGAPQPAGTQRASDFVQIERSEAVCALAERAADELGCSLPAFLLACWQSLFWRLDRAVPTTGVTVAARKYAELFEVVGPLDRTAPLGSRVRDDMTVAAFARGVDRAWQGTVEWQEYYDWRRDGVPPGHVYDLGFAHVAWPTGWTLGDVHARLTHPHVDVTGARLTLTFCTIGSSRVLSVQSDPRAHSRSAVRRLVRIWSALVEGAAARPHATLDSLPLLTASEREQITTSWNATARLWPDGTPLSLLAWIDAQAARTPDAVAVAADEGAWTYAVLHAQANQIARRLQRLGVGPESRVGVWVPRSGLLVAALVGVVKAGAAYVPLDPTYPAPRLAFQVSDADVTVVLTTTEFASAVPAGAYVVDVLDAADAAWRQELPTAPTVHVSPEQLAYVIYTSGSTGRPKGAMNTHRAIANRLAWTQATYDLGPSDRVLQKTSSSFDVSVWEFFWPLGIGATVVVAQRGVQHDPVSLAALIVRAQVTVVHFVPALLEAFVAAGGLAACAAVRLIVSSGEALSGSLAARCCAAWPGRLENLYGPTEAAVDVTWQSCATAAADAGTVPIGRPVANTQVYIRERGGEPVPVGVVGELHLGGVQVGRGYWRRPELTAERFVPDPFSTTPGARLYRTGDLARYRPDGTIEYAGRCDHQVKLHGNRIELGEIEAALRQQADVRDAAVLLREDEPGVRRLVAYVVARSPAAGVTGELLQTRLRSQLPEYMVPAVVVLLVALPLTPNGKVDRRSLPAPNAARTGTRDYLAPRTPFEEIVVGVWQEVLHLRQVGVNDNFLAVGGDSLNAVQVLVRLREAFGREIALRTLFERTTPAALAEELLRPDGGRVDEPPLERVSRHEPLPVSFGQERLWVIDRVTGSDAYRLPLATEIAGDIDVRALLTAITALATRHEVLRTTIGVDGGRPVQVIAPPAEVPVPYVDLSALTRAQRTRASQAVLRQLDSLPFDLQRGPLWRVTIVRLDPQTHIFTCFMHHIVADGWSFGVLLRDLTALYEAARSGRPAQLPELPVQYADYAVWQRRLLGGGRQAAELAYWRAQLSDLTPLALPTDRPRGPLPGVQGGTVTRQWDAAFSREVQAWSRAESATAYMVLLAAWQALLARYAGQQDVAVGTPIAQRSKQELEPLIGFFLNTLVLRTHVNSSASWRTLVSNVRSRALAAYAHQTVPFERIIDALQPERDLPRSPFFQVMFVFQNNPQPAVSLGELHVTPVDVPTRAAKFDLVLEATSLPDGLACALHYDALLFDRSTVDRMLQHLEALVRAALDAPDAPIATLSLLSEAERQQIYAPEHFPLLTRSVSAAQEWSLEQTIVERFHRIVKRSPTRVAVKTPQESWSYRELNRSANRVARAVLQAGRRRRVRGSRDTGRVALLCSHDATMLAAIIGALKAGRAYVPLDPRAPAARLSQVWADAEPCAIVTDEVHAALARDIASGAAVVIVDVGDAPGRAPRLPRAPADTPAYVLYTSGSTGEPKGVVQSHRNILYFIRTYTANLRLQPTDKLTLLPSYGFDAAVMDIFGALLNGAAVYPFSLRHATPEQLADWIDLEQITVLHATPTVFRTLMSSLDPGRVLSSVRLVVLGGEAAWRSDAEQFAQHFAPSCLLVNGLGPTESTVTLQSFTSHANRLTRSALPVGYPVDGTRVHLLDDNGYDAEVLGEIVVDSPHVAVGYWRRDDLTRAAFEEIAGDGGRRRYRTGDVGRRLPDGSLEFMGRKDKQVKIRGYRVELGEVETALARHPAVRDCVVSVSSDARGSDRLVAYVVPRDGEAPESRDLRRFVGARLPDPMVPSSYVFLEALPFRPNGKVDRDALPPAVFEVSSAEYVAPRHPAEQSMADLWCELLGVDRVGVNDNFFELGGDSIKAIQITARVRAVGVAMTPWLVFQHQTIAELVAALASAPAPADGANEIEPAAPALDLTDDDIAQLALRVEFEAS